MQLQRFGEPTFVVLALAVEHPQLGEELLRDRLALQKSSDESDPPTTSACDFRDREVLVRPSWCQGDELVVIRLALRRRKRRAWATAAKRSRQSGPDPELDHVVQLIRGSKRVEAALGLVVTLVLLAVWWLA